MNRAASGREAASFSGQSYGREIGASLISPLNSALWQQSAGGNSEAQWDIVFHGLADYVKDEIYTLELPMSLDGLVSLAIRVDADYTAERSASSAELRRKIGWTTCLSLPVTQDISFADQTPADGQTPSFPGERGGAEAA